MTRALASAGALLLIASLAAAAPAPPQPTLAPPPAPASAARPPWPADAAAPATAAAAQPAHAADGSSAQAAAAAIARPSLVAARPPAPRGDAAALAPLMERLRPAPGAAPTGAAPVLRTTWTASGALGYLGAPAGQEFGPGPTSPGGPDAGAAAVDFMRANAALFGIHSPAVDFEALRVKDRGGRVFVIVRETYARIPMFGAEATVQMGADNGVQSVVSDLITDTSILDAGGVPLTPVIGAAQAMGLMQGLAVQRGAPATSVVGPPVLMLFDPATLETTGPPMLVWYAEVEAGDLADLHAQWMLDAQTGVLAQEFVTAETALNRTIYDANGDTLNAPIVRRTEGQSASGIGDVDLAYDIMGETYAYYQTHFGRDGVDGLGLPIIAVARICSRGVNAQCPWPNAQWLNNAKQFQFGAGFVIDDATAHEFTHGVTQFESGLVYSKASGAINESLSDVFGEFLDFVDPRGNDAANVRWQIGEDLSIGYLRSMSNPTLKGHPDRLGSPNYYNGNGDNGGVHTNSGVNNKLCYLLTDGDTFNGQSIRGLGQTMVERLYYEAQTNLLNSTSGWTQLYNALVQAAVNLGWNDADQSDLYNACVAVEIAAPGSAFYVDQGSICPFEAGLPSCVFLTGSYRTVSLGQSRVPAGSTLVVRAGTYLESPPLAKPLTLQADGGVVTIHP